MATIRELAKTLPKQMYKKALYNALGEELTNELNNAGCELIINDDLETYEFTNMTADLQSKIDAKKRY